MDSQCVFDARCSAWDWQCLFSGAAAVHKTVVRPSVSKFHAAFLIVCWSRNDVSSPSFFFLNDKLFDSNYLKCLSSSSFFFALSLLLAWVYFLFSGSWDLPSNVFVCVMFNRSLSNNDDCVCNNDVIFTIAQLKIPQLQLRIVKRLTVCESPSLSESGPPVLLVPHRLVVTPRCS